MLGEKEESPALGAPGSNNYTGLIPASRIVSRGDNRKFQGLSEKEVEQLCKGYKQLAYKIALHYRGKGIDDHELKAASQLGLVEASKNFNPNLGIPFAGFAKFRIAGAVKDLFHPKRFAPDTQRKLSLDASEDPDRPETLGEMLAGPAPAIAADLTALSETDRRIVEARTAGYTLTEVGKVIDLSPERVRQRELRARKQIKGSVARAAICDLVKRRGYRKPYFDHLSLQVERLKESKYPGRHCSKSEIEAYKPQECITPPNILLPLWVAPSALPSPSDPVVEINRNGRWESLQRPGEGSRSNAEARGLVRALRLNKDARLPVGVEQKQGLEIERHRNECLRQLHGVPDSFDPQLSAALSHHRVNRYRLAYSRGNYPLRNSRGPYGGPVIHGWPR